MIGKHALVSVVDDESVRESLPDLLSQFGFATEAFPSAVVSRIRRQRRRSTRAIPSHRAEAGDSRHQPGSDMVWPAQASCGRAAIRPARNACGRPCTSTRSSTRPRFAAIPAACVRDVAPSLVRMALRCDLTVPTSM